MNPHEASPKLDIAIGQTFETESGKKYKVENIARESGNIEDLFVIYTDEENPTTYWMKKTTEITTANDFEVKTEIHEPAETEVQTGQEYQHFKTKDHYIIKCLPFDANDSSKRFVVYEGRYNSEEFGDHPVWIREYDEFAGLKTFDDGREPVKRFAFVK